MSTYIRSELPRCIIRAIPTCTLWRCDAERLSFAFRPYPRLRVSFQDIHMAQSLHRPILWGLAELIFGGRMISREDHDYIKGQLFYKERTCD